MLTTIIYYKDDKIIATEGYNFIINLNKLYSSIAIFMDVINATKVKIKCNDTMKDYLNSYKL